MENHQKQVVGCLRNVLVCRSFICVFFVADFSVVHAVVDSGGTVLPSPFFIVLGFKKGKRKMLKGGSYLATKEN